MPGAFFRAYPDRQPIADAPKIATEINRVNAETQLPKRKFKKPHARVLIEPEVRKQRGEICAPDQRGRPHPMRRWRSELGPESMKRIAYAN